ncbi:hypothetical protein MCELHM10_02366 [Paracoccaceae bacterium]|jgi:hypothetical protein
MKLTAKTDLDAPAGFVYACLADHAAWERDAAQRGIEIERPVDMPLSGLGAGWLVKVPFRGQPVAILLRLEQQVPPERLGFAMQSKAIEGDFVLNVIELSPRRTRLQLVMEVKARTIAARLLLNTLTLARGRVQARVEKRVRQIGAMILDRHLRGKG